MTSRSPDLSATEGSDILVRRWLVTEGARSSAASRCSRSKPTRRLPKSKSVATGTVLEILAAPDMKVSIGQVIARIEIDA